MEHKRDEIKEHFKDFLRENSESILDGRLDLDEIHHEAFNSDYYIIGRYQAEQWLGDQTFEIIRYIRDYEIDNFGDGKSVCGSPPEVFTDFTEPEKVVNMYVYIVGEAIVNDWRVEFEQWTGEDFHPEEAKDGPIPMWWWDWHLKHAI